MDSKTSKIKIIYNTIQISLIPNPYCICCGSGLAAANLPPAQRSDASEGGNDADREMDPDEALLRCVTMLIKAPCQTGTRKKRMRY
jgi:hypothetical protein